MRLARRLERRKSRQADPQDSELAQRHVYFETSDNAPAGAIGGSAADSDCTQPGEDAVEAMNLTDSLMQFAADRACGVYEPPETESEGTATFDIIDDQDDIYGIGVSPEGHYAILGLVDTSRWFEHNDARHESYEPVEEQDTYVDDWSAADAFDEAEQVTYFDTTLIDSSIPNGDVMGTEPVESDQDRKLEQDDRRRHPREVSSDLVWVEYFNSSNECTAKEAARVENVGAGGMRVAVRSGSPDLERVIVSYPYRGFESRSIVRSRYQSADGQEHLCLEFADREWTVIATGGAGSNGSDQFNFGRILLADDDAAFRKILGNILSRAGYDVVLAEDGDMAVKKAASERPDLVMTDGLMPKLHGFQVCKAVKELNPRLKVIMLTAVYTSPNYMWEAKTKFGADDVITKPFEVKDLLSKIKKHMPVERMIA
jgi:CheY-like chemotaxis protein